ncbi:PTS sugar transporter subunit IIA [Halanaerobacter jeridensis]|uniref:Fructose-specific phosphotransferase system IIA component n=1 Tax=Halanaerobacter jeridensis TaxID=706427 RepID=A0A939BSP9_9FIRM|nr:PTS sugar transporter subunit IIA [Halanaerobacter jeridensis]MBM7557376.1 fructose-specific phosphotransferase system IIA component [Halanaerobacter jeridensis]
MDVSELINHKLIDLSLTANNQLETIEALTDLLYQEDKITSKEEFKAGIIEREEEGTTGFGQKVAIPHCKSDSVKEVSMAVAKLKEGVDWNAVDEDKVKLVIMLAVPNQAANTKHIEILSTLSTKLMEDEFVEQLLAVKDKEKLIKLLSKD